MKGLDELLEEQGPDPDSSESWWDSRPPIEEIIAKVRAMINRVLSE